MASAIVTHAGVVHRRRELGAVSSSGPTSTYIYRHLWRISHIPRKQFVRPIRASSGRGFNGEEAARAFSKKADQLFNEIKRKSVEFQRENDLQGKAQRAVRKTSIKVEELSYDLRKQLGKWDRQYRISEKVQEAREYATEQALNVDREYGLRQKARNATQDFRLKLPTYRKQVTAFLETPLGKTVTIIVLVWFFLSGWAFRIFFFSLWFLPFAGPWLLQSIAKAAVVQGACPNCGTQYVGGRSQVVVCQRCRGVVWQPRQEKSDPTIIDINIDDN